MNRTRYKYRKRSHIFYFVLNCILFFEKKATLMSLVLESKQPICFQMLFKLGGLPKRRLESEILFFHEHIVVGTHHAR